ncbi:MAG: acylphosphatase [archaeon]
MLNIKRVHIIVSGRVQGVFFRAFAKQAADSLGLKGFVRNLQNGSVEAIAQGAEEKLNEFLKQLKKGPQASMVDSVTFEFENADKEFKDFAIRY